MLLINTVVQTVTTLLPLHASFMDACRFDLTQRDLRVTWRMCAGTSHALFTGLGWCFLLSTGC